MRRTLLSFALSVVFAGSASAQQPLKLSFHDGRVTVDATAVPVRTILSEWAKIGGTKVVGAERISGAPVTVKLVNVTEAQALETILRSVAGYLAAPRTAATTGPSVYDRILVMATSSTPVPAPAAARTAPAAPNAFAGTQRFVPPRRDEQPEQQDEDEPDENPPSPPVFTFPQPGQNGNFVPGTPVNAPGSQPGFTPANTPQSITINPAPTAPGQPTMPIGVPQPGMMVPAPQPAAPVRLPRPPGDR